MLDHIIGSGPSLENIHFFLSSLKNGLSEPHVRDRDKPSFRNGNKNMKLRDLSYGFFYIRDEISSAVWIAKIILTYLVLTQNS